MTDGSVLVVRDRSGHAQSRRSLGRLRSTVVAELRRRTERRRRSAPTARSYVANNGACFEFLDVGLHDPRPTCRRAYWGHGVDPARRSGESGEVTTLYTECDDISLRACSERSRVRRCTVACTFTDHGLRLDRSIGSHRRLLRASPTAQLDLARCFSRSDAPERRRPLVVRGDRLHVAENAHGSALSTGRRRARARPRSPSRPLRRRADPPRRARAVTLFDSLAVDGDGWICVATLGRRRHHGGLARRRRGRSSTRRRRATRSSRTSASRAPDSHVAMTLTSLRHWPPAARATGRRAGHRPRPSALESTPLIGT